MNLPNMKDVTAASRQVATKSAMNSILWISAIFSSICIICSVIAHPPLSYVLVGGAFLPVLVACWGFIFFAVKEPNRLQSEQHIEQMEVLTKLVDNRAGIQILLSDRQSLPAPNPTESDDD